MDDRLKKVVDAFAEEFELIEGDKFVDENEEYLDFFRDVSFWISEKDRLSISFYSYTHPVCVANYIKALHKHGVTEFDVYDNMYPLIENGRCVGMLFGDEADNKYKKDIYDFNKSIEMVTNIKREGSLH